ncbi:hypothetical protein [Tolypothrix sp. NIES-4075]|uniref:hypothetical protein n=1 Tax=Tolypothrix sp. NIES-4075 TaxID=2005459 RepID=UPI001180B3D1|nr:hypothetical protein [Tolypothrix sp. NIES-4075]
MSALGITEKYTDKLTQGSDRLTKLQLQRLKYSTLTPLCEIMVTVLKRVREDTVGNFSFS